MPGKIRPSARKKTLYNVKHSALSTTDKKCIEEVFKRYDEISQNEYLIEKNAVLDIVDKFPKYEYKE